MARSDSLRTTLDFGVALYQGMLPWLSTSTTGAVGSPQFPDRPSLHAVSSTPERFRAAPESMARTAAFTLRCQARPARSLTGHLDDAAEFTLVTACSFASPRFDARISPNAGGWLPGSSGGLPGRDSHPPVDRSLYWAHHRKGAPWLGPIGVVTAPIIPALSAFYSFTPGRLPLSAQWIQLTFRRWGRWNR